MAYNDKSGYTPIKFEEAIEELRINLNQEFNQNFTAETFKGTDAYRFAYSIVQYMIKNDNRYAEVIEKAGDYLANVNREIKIPAVAQDSLIDKFIAEGIPASVNNVKTAGVLDFCLDNTASNQGGFDNIKNTIIQIFKDYTAAGLKFVGDEVNDSEFALSNGQFIPVIWYEPVYYKIKFKVTIKKAKISQFPQNTVSEIQEKVINNFHSRWQLGKNIEPQAYLSVSDVPWASSVLVEFATIGLVKNEFTFQETGNFTGYSSDITDLSYKAQIKEIKEINVIVENV